MSALLLLAAFDPIHQPITLAFALVPLLWRLRQPHTRPWRVGYTFGLVYGAGQLFWLDQLTVRWTSSPFLGLVPWILATAIFALYFGLVCWLIQRAWLWNTPVLIPVLWAGVEVFRSYVPVLAFPWGLVASPLWRYPLLIGSARFGTIYWVGACSVALNVALAQLISHVHRKKAIAPFSFALFGCVLSVGAYVLSAPTHSERISVGQPGVDLAFSDPGVAERAVVKSVGQLEGASKSAGAGLLVLPEGLIQTETSNPPRVPFSVLPGLPILFGGQRGVEPTFQSAFAYDGRWKVADKTRLVIFGEFVPGRNLIPFLDQFRLPTGDLQAGNRVTALDIGRLRVGPVLCFEGLFPDICWRQAMNGADLLAEMSMDDWFMGTTALDQLRAATIWRAVETDLPVVRAATTGYSLIADAHGRIEQTAPLGPQYRLQADVQIRNRRQEPFWLPAFPVFALIASLWVASPMFRMRQSKANAS